MKQPPTNLIRFRAIYVLTVVAFSIQSFYRAIVEVKTLSDAVINLGITFCVFAIIISVGLILVDYLYARFFDDY